VRVIGFIIRIYHDARSPERQAESALLNSQSVSVLEHVLVRKSPPPHPTPEAAFCIHLCVQILQHLTVSLIFGSAQKKVQ